ncbi:PHB depolymerase family esterase [Allorhizobium sp. BGMRC 0089]|uniref:extracellular catalytic domain type 1 short-chain-length polyhydroxyalkanoate depolymerase n=1 Tax=Allorhizobium sonneratiae TaxID=2934936 RepID=UPI00203411C9|nr:PHB depolymerase family esterase [Allorhizobium sonneratiae]MCM2292135.1 PHB depolymerase family esterase [Allorhizobium sonneratiae]
MRMTPRNSIATVLRQQKKWQKALVDFVDDNFQTALPQGRKQAVIARPALTETLEFGTNAGHLKMLSYVPEGLKKGAPLVVVLHGCGQTAEEFDRGSGWSALARRHKFALLYPEQRPSNNANGCFNWFRPSAVARDRGEAGSIRQMIDLMIETHELNEASVHIMGLSAGGAMAAAMLAAYPEKFRSGAIVAGLPVGCARDAMTALNVMHSGTHKTTQDLADLVEKSVPEAPQRWPDVTIVQGSDDSVVHGDNALALLTQWLAVHGLDREREETVQRGTLTSRVWANRSGKSKVEFMLIDGMEHGLPVLPGKGEDLPFMLPAPLHLPAFLAQDWGLTSR